MVELKLCRRSKLHGKNLVPASAVVDAVEQVDVALYAPQFLFRLARRIDKLKKKQLYSSALERVGLPGYEKRKIYTLSGGEQQRIALAKIMVKSPQLILADEPTGSLDARNRDIVLAMLRQLNEEGKTIVVVTHDPTVSACAKRHINLG